MKTSFVHVNNGYLTAVDSKHLIEEGQKAAERRDLRDRFAMAALAAAVRSYSESEEAVAERAYRIADAMLEERAK